MHLSSEKISQWIAGDGTPGDREHIQACAECRAEVGKLQNALSSYSGFARDWGRIQAPAAPSLSHLLRGTRRPAHVAGWVGLAAAAAAAILVLFLPRAEESRQIPSLIEDTAQDALLLQQVNARISRTAPVAMDPLLRWMEEEKPTKEGIGGEQ
jgi:anti-sigma factor RsiW